MRLTPLVQAMSSTVLALTVLTSCSTNENATHQNTPIPPTSIVDVTSPPQSPAATIVKTHGPNDTAFIPATDVANLPIVKEAPKGPPSTYMPTPSESEFDIDGDGSYTYDELVQAVNYLFPSYAWPENYQVTPEMLISKFAPLPDPGAAQFEAQYEYTLLGLYHVCAWLDAFQVGDQELIAESEYQLQDVALANPVFIYIKDDLAQIFDRASLGDTSLLQQYIDNSCATYTFITPEPSEQLTTNGLIGLRSRAIG